MTFATDDFLFAYSNEIFFVCSDTFCFSILAQKPICVRYLYYNVPYILCCVAVSGFSENTFAIVNLRLINYDET